jgi:PAS domain S-box-containing protein
MSGNTGTKSDAQTNYVVLALLVIALVAQLLVGYFSYRAMTLATRTADLVSQTHEAIGQLERLHQRIAQAESDRRGWLLSGERRFLENHNSLLRGIPGELDRIRSLTADNAEQQQNLIQLERYVRAKVGHMENLALDEARSRDSLLRGLQLMVEIRQQVNRMERLENSLLQARQREAELTNANAQRSVIVGNLFGLVLITLAMAGLASARGKQQAAEFAVRQSETNYRNLVSTIPDASWTADADGRVLFMSENVRDICGFSPEEVVGGGLEFWVQWVHPDDRQVLRDRFQALFTQHQAYDFEYRFQRKDGQWIWLHARATVTYQRDGQTITNGILSDITKRKVAEEQNVALRRALEDANRELQRASHLKSQFLASMSHELRTPLNAIVGFSDLLADETAGSLNEKQKRFVNHVRNGSSHLLRLINDVLDISKVEAGQMELHPEDLDFQDVLPEVLSLVRPLAMQGNVRLETDVVPTHVRADRVRLKQVLYNLLSNAIKFTPPGGQVTIESRPQGALAHISVIDTGVGIPLEDQDKIFEEFRQVGESSKGIKEGTGLGLAISSRIVALHGGDIWVESEPGKGSRFTVALPAAAPPDRGPGPDKPRVEPLPFMDGHAPLVLIIDDDPSASELIGSFLAPEGYRLMSAHSAVEGLQLARKHRPDIITLDILMPDGNGFGTLFELRADPNTADIPIVVASIVDQRKMGISFGAKEYLVKPIDKQALLQAVRRQIGRAQTEQEILVVDDDAPTASVIREELKKQGYSCQVVVSGPAALAHLETRSVGLILLDLLMPDMNGFEVLKRLKASERLSSIPVIVITAKTLTPAELEVLKQQTRGYIEKTGPWTERLKSDVRKFLSQRKEELL